MATAQAFGLVTHACAIHHGHPYAEQMMADDIAALESSGAIEDVIRTLGDLLEHALGHPQAMDMLTARYQSGQHVTPACSPSWWRKLSAITVSRR